MPYSNSEPSYPRDTLNFSTKIRQVHAVTLVILVSDTHHRLAATTFRSVIAGSLADPWVGNGIQQVCKEIHQHVGQADRKDTSLN